MSHLSLAEYVYAAILFIGGLVGYTKGKSTVSLIAGVICAAVAIAAGFVAPQHPHISEAIAGVLALVMIGVFVGRYQKTKNAMPAVPMIVISVLMLLAIGMEALKK